MTLHLISLKKTQEWIARNFPDFISVDISPQRPGHWPANSPDLNPLGYLIWGILESVTCAKPHSTVGALKRDLSKAWNDFLWTSSPGQWTTFQGD
ncbi:hypothetical protein Y032_0032g2521 [Ancylostoma ceylanicum]|uniref:Uncharacterized protein n=1 Tax=Ancylostoma ceylanicum TaxID=53326 RepID=A0A016UN60_9BILA|nr:hypothetical protein Y032_0032g2521 [Ancylostoma ceylanicum]